MPLLHSNSFAMCVVNIASLKSEPAHRSETVSQLLFGEKVMLTGNAQASWCEIVSATDDYRGWCLGKQLLGISREQFKKLPKKIVGVSGAQLHFADHTLPLFAGSDVSLVNKKMRLFEEPLQKVKGAIMKAEELEFSMEQLELNARQCLLAPYLWGGKTIAGIDCSGFTQLLYRLMGVTIPRDASQQAEVGDTIYFLHESRVGDLAFFDNEAGNIAHVGVILRNGDIVHATETSGGVVIDKIDQEGIVSKRLKQRTHRLRIIKRIVR